MRIKEDLEAFLHIYFEPIEKSDDFTFSLTWKTAALPHIQWPEEYLRPELQRFQRVLMIWMIERVSFPMGLLFPLSVTDPASYEFLGRFNADAPFKMIPKHFKVVMNGKRGPILKKADEATVARLQEFIV
jgi:hypothetical protein